MFDKELKTLFDLRTDEDRRHYNACAYEDEHGERIDEFLSSDWEEIAIIFKEVTYLDDFILKELYHFEHDRPICTRWKPIAARGKGELVDILYYGYRDNWNGNNEKPFYSVFRVKQLTEYIPIKERKEV